MKKNLEKLPRNGIKPISREVLARCVDEGLRIDGFMDSELVQRIREDESFDVVLVSSSSIEQMEVSFHKYAGEIPMYDCYCGHAIEKILRKLPYAHNHKFTSSIHI